MFSNWIGYKPECSICLSQIDNEQKQPFICKHSFHNQCIDQWIRISHNCPLCRETKLIVEPSTKNIKKIYTYILAGYAIYFNIDINKYIAQWNKDKCISYYKHHDITFQKPYGVVGYCSCGEVQAFNL